MEDPTAYRHGCTRRPQATRRARSRVVNASRSSLPLQGPWQGDASLSALLVVQGLTLFVVLPYGATHPSGRLLQDLSNLVFAGVSAVALTRRSAVRAALLAGLALLVATPVLAPHLGLGDETRRTAILTVAFTFNALVTTLVAGRVFGPGRVTGHRVQGAVLVYLNVAALFAIAYSMLEAYAPGAVAPSAGGALSVAATPGSRVAALSYFSLATITTTGYGDLVPVHPLARSLANLEAAFGQLFPATLLARLVALHLNRRPA